MAATRTASTSVVLCLLLAGFSHVVSAETQGTVYGDGVTLEQSTAISTLFANAAEYDGKKVRVDGVVTAVCEKRGCWMQLADPETGDAIRIKVDDGVIVFPMSAKGHKATAEGTFTVIQLTEEQMAARQGKHGDCPGKGDCAGKAGAGHDCKHKGESGHDCQGHHGTGTVYLIRGTGAVVY